MAAGERVLTHFVPLPARPIDAVLFRYAAVNLSEPPMNRRLRARSALLRHKGIIDPPKWDGSGHMEKLARRFAILTLTMAIFALIVSALVKQPPRSQIGSLRCPLTTSVSCLAAL
jgi:hypothetical protein